MLFFLFFAADLSAATNDRLIGLEAEMLKYFETTNREAFVRAASKLEEASKEEYDERMFYKAWGYRIIYDATHHFGANILDRTNEMKEYALNEGSIYGEYASLHTRAMVLLQIQDNKKAERAFVEALYFRRRHFPNESAAEDLRELMKISYYRGDILMAKKYGQQLLAEPNVTPHHKGRVLSRLSTIAFDEDSVEEFNHIYNEMIRLEKTDGIRMVTLFTKVNYYIINSNYEKALLLVDGLSADTCAERKAIIFHRLGDNEKAYEYMVQYNHISDSLQRVLHDKNLASLYLRINNDRLRLERESLTNQNNSLRYRFYFTIAVVLILILLFLIYKRHKIVKMLKRDNTMLDYGKRGAERTLKDLHELSFYESKKGLSLDMPVNVNQLCDRLASEAQKHSRRDVIVIFQTDFTDNFVLLTNSDALEKILNHLLNSSSQYTNIGLIWIKCVDMEECVRFSVTDTCMEKGNFNDANDIARISNMALNVCQSICRLLHGRIWHDMDYSNGVRFIIEIPKSTVIDNTKTPYYADNGKQ
jgi:signal transduction histidine kinase